MKDKMLRLNRDAQGRVISGEVVPVASQKAYDLFMRSNFNGQPRFVDVDDASKYGLDIKVEDVKEGKKVDSNAAKKEAEEAAKKEAEEKAAAEAKAKEEEEAAAKAAEEAAAKQGPEEE